jgi:hypothetical protein
VSARLQAVVIVAHLAVGVTVLAAVTALSVLGKPITAFAAGIFGAVVGLAGGGAAATATLGTALNGKSAVSPDLLANQQQIIREAQNLLAAQAPISDAALQRATDASSPPLKGGGG